MYTRSFIPPKRSYLLLGPRGTGKTTWLKSHYPKAIRYDLLKPSEYFRLQSDPSLFEKELLSLPKSSTVIVDEIQKIPTLLDVAHEFLSDKKLNLQFVMTGSSARKLKRNSANLLAGRASFRNFFPLIQNEYAKRVPIDQLLQFGSLPEVFDSRNKDDKIEFLESYAFTYLQEEIRQEVAVKNIDSFSRFLKVAGICNGQVTNLSSLARDAGVARSSIQGYFQALEDTLIGSWLKPWRPKIRVKESGHPKLYFFDVGVARVLSGKIRQELDSQDRGFLLETYLYHELMAWKNYQNNQATLGFWKTKDSEVDFVIEVDGKVIGIEVKSSKVWKAEYGKTLKRLHQEKIFDKIYGVFLGDRAQQDSTLSVIPLYEFLDKLWSPGLT